MGQSIWDKAMFRVTDYTGITPIVRALENNATLIMLLS